LITKVADKNKKSKIERIEFTGFFPASHASGSQLET